MSKRDFCRFPSGQKWVTSRNKCEIKDVYEGYKFVWGREVEEIVCVWGGKGWLSWKLSRSSGGVQGGASLPGYWWGGRYKEILTIHPLRFTTWRAWQYWARQLIALSVMWRQPVELNDFNLWHPLARASTPKTILNFTKWFLQTRTYTLLLKFMMCSHGTVNRGSVDKKKAIGCLKKFE